MRTQFMKVACHNIVWTSMVTWYSCTCSQLIVERILSQWLFWHSGTRLFWRFRNNGDSMKTRVQLISQEIIHHPVSLHKTLPLKLWWNYLDVKMCLICIVLDGCMPGMLIRNIFNIQRTGLQRRLQFLPHPSSSWENSAGTSWTHHFYSLIATMPKRKVYWLCKSPHYCRINARSMEMWG